jgi:hypothetical protein
MLQMRGSGFCENPGRVWGAHDARNVATRPYHAETQKGQLTQRGTAAAGNDRIIESCPLLFLSA